MLLRAVMTCCVVVTAAAGAAEAGKLAPEVMCGVIAAGKVEVVVPTPDKRKLDKPVSCAIHLDAVADPKKTLVAQMFASAPGAMKHNGPIAPDKDFEQVLVPGDDFPACGDFTITARVTNDDDKVLWEKVIAVATPKCAPAAPAAKPAASKPAPQDDTAWADGELAKLPADANVPLVSWVNMYVFLDNTFFDTYPTSGVRIGKTMVTRKTIRALSDKAGGAYLVTKIMPMFNCKDPADAMKTPSNCEWGKWHAVVQSKTEIWVYNTDDAFYGPWQAAVFTKKGGTWVWTAVKAYDQGEP